MKTVVLEAGGLVRASTAPALEAFLRRHPAIDHVEASYLSETVTVGYDESRISEAEIRGLIEKCGFHCQGQVMPRHVCAAAPGVAAAHRPPALTDDDTRHVVAQEPASARERATVSTEMSARWGAGYLFSVGATFFFESEVFYEAAVVLPAFVLFGHRMEVE
jgi:Cu2+-exporting ATPase